MLDMTQGSVPITRRAALFGVSSLAVLCLPTLKANATLRGAFSSNGVGAVLYDMPYLNRNHDFAYQPAVGLVGGKAVAELDEAVYRSHHIYV